MAPCRRCWRGPPFRGSRTVVPLYACFPLVKLGFQPISRHPSRRPDHPVPPVRGPRHRRRHSLGFRGRRPLCHIVAGARRRASEVLDHGKTPRLADLSIANPHSFLPVFPTSFSSRSPCSTSQRACALTFLANEGVPQSTVFSILPPAILLAAWLLGKPCSANLMVKVSALLILLGFSVVPLAEASSPVAQGISTASTGLFAIGSSLFNVVFYLVLSETGKAQPVCLGPPFRLRVRVVAAGLHCGRAMSARP